MGENRYRWAASGDVSAFFGLMLDNIAGLVLAFVVLLKGVFGFPVDFALRYMVPGTAIGVLVGDLLFFWLSISIRATDGQDGRNRHATGLGYSQHAGHGVVRRGTRFCLRKTAIH